MHSIWDLCVSGLQECKGKDFFKVGRVQKITGAAAPNRIPRPPPKKTICRGYLTSSSVIYHRVKYRQRVWLFLIFNLFFETEGKHANAKAQEAVDHLSSFYQVKRRFHNRDLTYQPFPWDLGTSPPSSSSLRSSRTRQRVLLRWGKT